MIQKYIDVLKLNLTDKEIEDESKQSFKLKVKEKTNSLMFSELLKEQKEHSKIKDICYTTLTTQKYLKTHLLNNHEVSLLFSLRSQTLKHFKANFPYFSDQMCPLGCPVETLKNMQCFVNQYILSFQETQIFFTMTYLVMTS